MIKKKDKRIRKQIHGFTVVFKKEPEGIYTLHFPSLPGCYSYGNDFEHAKEMAEEVLGLGLWVMIEDKKPIPTKNKVADNYVSGTKKEFKSEPDRYNCNKF